jgi:hypothetical protein
MRVELLVGVSGLDFTWKPGEIVDMSGEQAAAWADGVRGRLVEPVPPAPPATEPAGESPADDEAPAELVPPPKSGAGSGVEAWRAYAEANDVEIPADAKREQIWAALADAGIPVDQAAEDGEPQQ